MYLYVHKGFVAHTETCDFADSFVDFVYVNFSESSSLNSETNCIWNGGRLYSYKEFKCALLKNFFLP